MTGRRALSVPIVPLPDQAELRRRLKAARALRGLTVAELAARIPVESKLGERTLRKFESGEQALLPPVMRELASVLDVDYEWFTVADVGTVPSNTDRLATLERQVDALLDIAATRIARDADEAAAFRTRAEGRVDEPGTGHRS